jgi:hypothetical protein
MLGSWLEQQQTVQDLSDLCLISVHFSPTICRFLRCRPHSFLLHRLLLPSLDRHELGVGIVGEDHAMQVAVLHQGWLAIPCVSRQSMSGSFPLSGECTAQ